MTDEPQRFNKRVDNCPINERTGDGVLVGRCWFACKNGVCPRHGDVSNAIKHFEVTGKLTPEQLYG